jgi:hypothetical protein
MIDQLDSGMEEMNHKSSSIERERDKTNVEWLIWGKFGSKLVVNNVDRLPNLGEYISVEEMNVVILIELRWEWYIIRWLNLKTEMFCQKWGNKFHSLKQYIERSAVFIWILYLKNYS